MKNCITCSFRSSEPEKYYKKYMKKMHMICKMEEKRVKYMCFGTNDVLKGKEEIDMTKIDIIS